MIQALRRRICGESASNVNVRQDWLPTVKRSQLEDDRALARRVSAGNEAAFEEFFREYFPRLYRFVLARVKGDAAMAEEVVQRTMCLVVRKMPGYRGEALLFTWLCQICRNEMSSLFRERRMAPDDDVPVEDNPAVQAALASLSLDLGPEKSRSDDEVARFVRVTLEYLPARYACALEMKYIRGCSVDEIGEKLNISSKAAESMLSRARAAFKEGFRSLWDFEPDYLLE
jgi:RNA polymerase sigma-70 factor (ECF subfamily)